MVKPDKDGSGGFESPLDNSNDDDRANTKMISPSVSVAGRVISSSEMPKTMTTMATRSTNSSNNKIIININSGNDGGSTTAAADQDNFANEIVSIINIDNNDYDGPGGLHASRPDQDGDDDSSTSTMSSGVGGYLPPVKNQITKCNHSSSSLHTTNEYNNNSGHLNGGDDDEDNLLKSSLNYYGGNGTSKKSDSVVSVIRPRQPPFRILRSPLLLQRDPVQDTRSDAILLPSSLRVRHQTPKTMAAYDDNQDQDQDGGGIQQQQMPPKIQDRRRRRLWRKTTTADTLHLEPDQTATTRNGNSGSGSSCGQHEQKIEEEENQTTPHQSGTNTGSLNLNSKLKTTSTSYISNDSLNEHPVSTCDVLSPHNHDPQAAVIVVKLNEQNDGGGDSANNASVVNNSSSSSSTLAELWNNNNDNDDHETKSATAMITGTTSTTMATSQTTATLPAAVSGAKIFNNNNSGGNFETPPVPPPNYDPNNYGVIDQPEQIEPARERDDEPNKIFVGGLPWDTTEYDLEFYFSHFGKVTEINIKYDPLSCLTRGFCFVTFQSEETVNEILKKPVHIIKGKLIELKRAKYRPICKKVFVGGLDPRITEQDLKTHFSQYGTVVAIEIPKDRLRNRKREFCFVIYESELSAERACLHPKQFIVHRICDVKKAQPQPICYQQKRLAQTAGLEMAGNNQLTKILLGENRCINPGADLAAAAAAAAAAAGSSPLSASPAEAAALLAATPALLYYQAAAAALTPPPPPPAPLPPPRLTAGRIQPVPMSARPVIAYQPTVYHQLPQPPSTAASVDYNSNPLLATINGLTFTNQNGTTTPGTAGINRTSPDYYANYYAQTAAFYAAMNAQQQRHHHQQQQISITKTETEKLSSVLLATMHATAPPTVAATLDSHRNQKPDT